MRKKIKNTVQIEKQKACECFLTGIFFDGRISPLKLTVANDELDISLSTKVEANAIFIDIDLQLIKSLLNGKRKLPELYQSFIKVDIKEKIIDLYEKKFHKSLGFLLKSGQAVIGRRAIDRAMVVGHNDKLPLAVLKTPDGSNAICESFKFKKRDLKIVNLESDKLLKQVTARDKISYCCILDSTIGNNLINDYLKYLQFIKH